MSEFFGRHGLTGKFHILTCTFCSQSHRKQNCHENIQLRKKHKRNTGKNTSKGLKSKLISECKGTPILDTRFEINIEVQ
ncbi:hypothetical protein XELAEV_18029331mg [Xenopus laevis]|uniref:Uncharacterized protein n=1 Tax=Xenopus laevis TaxID=8355 RepID=A0A974CR43_XENLA|nr:hypothetical protein XELAEV_18029331mg [Xenopus laevis]